MLDYHQKWVLGELGPGQLGPGQLGPGLLGPGQLGPGAQLSGAQLSALKNWTVGPRTVGPRGPTVRGPTVRPQEVDSWAPDSCLEPLSSLWPYRIYMKNASIRPSGASAGQYGLIFFANFIRYEGCITVGGVYKAICRMDWIGWIYPRPLLQLEHCSESSANKVFRKI